MTQGVERGVTVGVEPIPPNAWCSPAWPLPSLSGEAFPSSVLGKGAMLK